jgi:hypothetical protein
MARTHLTAHKSTGHHPTGQLVPWNMPPPQEPYHDSPPHASQEEEPFEIELVVPSSQAAQGSPADDSPPHASPPPQDTGSRESRVHGGWNSRQL